MQKRSLNRGNCMCPVCSFSCDTYHELNGHFLETNHKNVQENQNPKTFCNPGSILKLKEYMKKDDREPLIGLEYVLEYRVQTGKTTFETRYTCELCFLDSALTPMIHHLTGNKHRRTYLATAFPFVLRAPSTAREDQTDFLRRMALEIEQEEGTKMYKIEEATKLESLLTLKLPPPTKGKTKKSRWDIRENSESKKKRKALEYLETFKIDTEKETNSVTKLIEKLKEKEKIYSMKKNEKILFSVRVAKAQHVAELIMQSSSKNLFQKPFQLNAIPGKALPINQGPIQQNTQEPSQQLGQRPTGNTQTNQNPIKQGLFMQSSQEGKSHRSENVQEENNFQFSKDPKPELEFDSQNNVTAEGDQFFKKLMELLSSLPKNTSNASLDPKLMLLQALLMDKTPSTYNMQSTLKLMMQAAFLTQDTKSQENAPLFQKLMTSMVSQPHHIPGAGNASFDLQTENTLLNQMMLLAAADKSTGNLENVHQNQHSIMDIAALIPSTQCVQNVSLPQNSMMEMTSVVPNTQNAQNIPLMQMSASLSNAQNIPINTNSIMQLDQGLLHTLSTEIGSINQNTIAQEDKTLQNYVSAANAQNSLMEMGQDFHKTDNLFPEVYEMNPQGYVNTSQIYGEFNYSGLQQDAQNYDLSKPTNELAGNLKNEPNASEIFSRSVGWENPHNISYSGSSTITPADVSSLYPVDPFVKEQSIAPYTRVSLSPKDSDRSKNLRRQELSYSRRDFADREICRKGVDESEIAHRRRSREPRSPPIRDDNDGHHSRSSSYFSSGKYSNDSVDESSYHDRHRRIAKSDSHHAKRARLDKDYVPRRSNSERESNSFVEPSASLGVKTEGLSADVLNRIRGKDKFTVTAILGEYAESRKSK